MQIVQMSPFNIKVYNNRFFGEDEASHMRQISSSAVMIDGSIWLPRGEGTGAGPDSQSRARRFGLVCMTAYRCCLLPQLCFRPVLTDF